MRDVKLVRLSDDGTHVVLIHEGTGEEFALRIDDRLRGFVTSDRARVAQLPVERPSRLSPKEIQARLRAGESSEDIAAAADVTLERVMRYAGPVLAEREYLAEQAQTALLRRPPGSAQNGGQSRALGSTVTDRLEALGTSTSQIRWDAWRMADGRWAVAVFYHLPGTSEEARATFGFDPVGRTVVPIDEAAEWILGERTSSQQQAPTTVEGPAPRTPRDARPRLTAVPPPPGDEPADRFDDRPDSVVRTLRPASPPASPPAAPTTPAAPTARSGEHGDSSGTGGASGSGVDDRIAYEPTVDLSRSMHDQPQPAPPAPSPTSTPTSAPAPAPASPSARAGADTRWTVERPSTPSPSRQSERPEPPRLSPADLPDLGESPHPVSAPPVSREPAVRARPETPAGPDIAVEPETADVPDTSEPVTARQAAEPEQVGRDALPSKKPSAPVESPPVESTPAPMPDSAPGHSEPLPAEPVPAEPAPAEPAPAAWHTPADERPSHRPTDQPVEEPAARIITEPNELAEPTAPSAPSPTTPQTTTPEPAPQPAAEHDAEVTARSAEDNGAARVEPVKPGPARTAGPSRSAGSKRSKSGKSATTRTTDNGADTENGSGNGREDTEGENAAAAKKQQLGQDRRTSTNRRRRAAGSRRKGSVPSWDDILFGGGRKD